MKRDQTDSAPVWPWNCSGNCQHSSALVTRLHFQACSCHVSACWVTTEPHAPIKYLNQWNLPRGVWASTSGWNHPWVHPEIASRCAPTSHHGLHRKRNTKPEWRSNDKPLGRSTLGWAERRGRTNGERGKRAAGWRGGRWAFTFISAGAGMSVLTRDVDKAWGEC